MKKLKIKLIERIAAVVVAIALLVGLAPDTLLLVIAETEEHMGTYTLAVCDEQGKPLSGAEVLWEICDEDGSNAVEQEKKTSGDDGICEMGEINSAFLEGEDGPEKIWFKISDIDQFGYTYTGQNAETADQNIYVVERADQNGHLEIRLAEKEAGMLTGRVETAEGEALKNAEILVEPGGKMVRTDAEGAYTVEGLYAGETYTVSASLKGYIVQTESIYIDDSTYWNFVLDAKKADAAFQFRNGKTPEMVYGVNGNKYSNLIIDDLSVLAPIEYTITEERNAKGEVVESETIAVISEGELTVLAAGTVVVEASNKDYQDSYTLTINKADQSIVFPEGDQSFSYGDRKEYVQKASEVENLDNADGKGYNDERICYKIEGENLLDAAVDENGTVTWGNGKTGSITVKASKAEDACYNACEATYKLTIKPADQKIVFDQKEIIKPYGIKELLLNASVVDGTGHNGQPIEYRIEGTNELEAEVKTNRLIFKEGKTGSVTVKASKAEGEGYNACEATCTVIIEKADQNIKFSSDSVSLIYGEQNDYTLEAYEVWNTESIDGRGYNDEQIYYEIEGENLLDAAVDENGTVTWGNGKTGSITVKASKAEDACYNACEATYKLTIKPADQKIVFDQKEIIKPYGIKELLLNASVVDGTGHNGQPIEYRIEGTNELEAEIKTDKLIFKEGKTGSVTVKASKAGGEGYNACEATCTVSIITAEQSIKFSSDSVSLTYGEQNDYTLEAYEVWNIESIDGKGHNDKPIVYSIEGANPTNVSVDSTGTVKFNKETIGEITVKATKPADEAGLYNEAWATYVIKIGKADQSIKFNQDSVTLTYGEQNDYTVKAYTVENTDKIDGDNDEKIKYSIVEGENSLGATIDEGTGKVTFVSGRASGKVKIKAVKSGNEYYNESSASYITIEMKPLSAERIAKPTLEGTSKNGWYSSVVKIHAPEGYHISYDNGTGNENWKNISLTYNKEGKNNAVVYLRSDVTKGITSAITISDIKIDTTKPVVEVSYDKTKPVKSIYYKITRTATIKITEANFVASEVNVTIMAKNISGKTVSSKASISNWKTDKTDASIHTATVTFPGSASYTLDISGEDIAGNTLLPYKQDKFVVDQSAPKTSDMKISYSKELKSWEKVINKVTFGYYAYKKGVTVTLTAKDNISGIEKMQWTYIREDGTSTDKNVKKKEGTISGSAIKYSSDGATATATFKLTASEAEQFRGTISFTATDRAGNTSKLKQDSERVNVVDTITPKRKVSFTPAKQAVNGKMYYDGPVTAAFQITEANFYSKDVVIKVNGKKKTPKNWKQDGDTWTGSIKISGDGEYVVTVTYKDRSNNQMKKYTSKKIVIDTKDPVIKVSYGNKDSKNTEGGTKYFDDVQTAVITIQEQNFRAKDVKANVTAKDINGNDVSVMDYASYLSDKKNWKKNGDTYTATISFIEDANYTFDIDYQDLTKRAAADYKQDSFTVDKTAPGNLTVSYSNSLVDKVLNTVTFGYYNAPMTVTVSAEDAISGVEHFTYSCRKDSGVSNVNAELIDAAIQKADIMQNGSTYTASFRIPQQVLENANQFNGTVDFCAYDYAANNSAIADDKRIVVDNIKPTADVSFGDPVREAGNISYYAGDILATVVIHEANFDASDVIVSVTKDGTPLAVTPAWQDDGIDVHTGTFTLHEDGDYTVSVNYTDASSNEMDPYISNQLTIDTQAPTVSVSNVKMNSANKDAVYSFSITASDVNFDKENFKPVLTALIQNEQGNYVTETIDLGTLKTSEAGSTYSYSVSNLDVDAVYKLVCTVSDMAGNEYTKLLLNEDHEEYDTVQFSINRNGSTYSVDEEVETLVEQYYIYGVTDDIKIEETNVDPIEAYTVKMNGENLTEGSDYTTTLTSNEGEWCKRTYTIKKDLFDAEGEYNVVVESTDKTNTTAYSDVKNLNVCFVVDRTPPVLTVSGLEENGRYQVQEQIVTVIPTDDGGKLESFQAVVFDADGNPSRDENGEDNSIRFDMSGEKFEEYLRENNGTITFTIPEGLERQVLLVCNDMALHTDGTTNECNEKFTKVTVSQSGWVIFYANKPLLYSMIAGIVLLIAAAGGIIVVVRRKK